MSVAVGQTGSSRPAGAPRRLLPLRYLVFAVVAVMMAYVLVTFERFVIDPSHPVWQHYAPFRWWLLPHGVAGTCVLVLAPLQFSDRLRARFLWLHRTMGALYVTGVFVLGPIGIYIQYLDEAQGAARSFTIETVIQSGLLMITAGFGLWHVLHGNIARHRQWMIRSYAAALTFLQIRVILGLTGLNAPPIDWHVLETVVWSCTACAILIGDIAIEIYERRPARAR